MQVFKLYFKILNKQKYSFLMYIIIFIMIMFLLLSSSGNEFTNFESSKTTVAIENLDKKSELMEHFTDYIKEHCEIVELENSSEAISDALYYRSVDYVITIPEGFAQDFVQGFDVKLEKQFVPDSAASLLIDDYINRYFEVVRCYLETLPQETLDEILEVADATLMETASTQIYQKSHTKEEESSKFYNTYFNPFSYILMNCFITGVGLILFSFHNIDIRRRNLVSTLSIRSMNVQLILGNAVFCLGFVTLFSVLAIVLNPSHMVNFDTFLYLLNTIVYSISALAFSYLIGIVILSRRAVTAISSVASLGMAFIGGAFVPQTLLNDSVIRIAIFTPVYWYVRVNNAILDLGVFHANEVNHIYEMMGIQLGFAAVFFTLVMVVSKKKRN